VLQQCKSEGGIPADLSHRVIGFTTGLEKSMRCAGFGALKYVDIGPTVSIDGKDAI
jgi:hypothetical protein